MPQSTRRRIIDSAVDLFVEEGGFAQVGVSRIAERAQITPGGFYYHFDSKEALAMAIAELAELMWREVMDKLRSRQPGLESVISMMFAITDLLKRDRLAWMGQHLALGLAQLSDDIRDLSAGSSAVFFNTISEMIDEADIRDDITREDMAVQIWMDFCGCHVLSDRFRDDPVPRMTRSWLTLLRGTVRAETLPYFEQFVRRTAVQYGWVSSPGTAANIDGFSTLAAQAC